MVRWHLVIGVLALCAGTAAADGDPDAMTTEGEALARSGEYTRAIALFKQADAIKPSAHHACLIGLVYTRRELWSQAEIFFDRCKLRATAADPLPEWFAEASKQLDEKLHATDVAEVEIRMVPAEVNATLAISTFAADETFGPRKIHIIPGTYTITATAPGYWDAKQTVTTNAGPGTVVTIRLEPKVKVPPSRAPWWFAAAGACAIGGVVFHVIAANDHGKLQDAATANDPTTWDMHNTAFESERELAIGLYAAAAITGAIGLVVRARYHEYVQPTLTTSSAGTPMIGIAVTR